MNIVYVLGAGCSVDDGAPVLNNFFDVAFNKIFSNVENEYESSFRNVSDSRERLLADSNVEEFFSYIDMLLELHTWLSDEDIIDIGQKGYDHPLKKKDLIKLRKDLLIVISVTLKNSLIDSSGQSYHFLRGKIDPADCVICMNWDLLMDSTFRFIDFEEGSLLVNYGFDFHEIKIDDNLKLNSVKLATRNETPLLKLHGSLNWCFCEKCEKAYFVYGQKIAPLLFMELKQICCPQCSEEKGIQIGLKPLMIPPTFSKTDARDIKNSIFSKIWLSAWKELVKCEKIIIIGYSFPDADMNFRLILRQAIQQHRVNNKIPVEIVDFKTSVSEQLEFENHYRKVFKGLERYVNITFQNIGFKRYIQRAPVSIPP